jgi:hypothetical protein
MKPPIIAQSASAVDSATIAILVFKRINEPLKKIPSRPVYINSPRDRLARNNFNPFA